MDMVEHVKQHEEMHNMKALGATWTWLNMQNNMKKCTTT
jgi:hypothetical protein